MAAKARLTEAMKAEGHCKHCRNSFGDFRCFASDHRSPCKQCGAKQGAQ